MLKRVIYFIIFLSSANSLQGQIFKHFSDNEEVDFEKRIEYNFNLLANNEPYVKEIIKILEGEIQVINPDTEEREFVLYEEEYKYFLSWFDSLDMYEIEEKYLKKCGSRVVDSVLHGKKEVVNRNEEKIKIAIDPGHFAGNMKEAIYEDRYVKFRFDSANQDTFINEASLNYDIALILKDMLYKTNQYEVMISRNYGKSAVGVAFQEWKKEEYIFDTRNLMANNEITLGMANYFMTDADEGELFRDVYTYIDFRERVKLMNAFNPDLSVMIHLNAYEFGGRNENGYSELTDENYSMVFVPGGFLRTELEKIDQRIDFVRLLVSNNIEESIKASNILSNYIAKDLNVPRFNNQIFQSEMVRFNTLPTKHEGIFARNLYMTRAIESPLIYGETLLQDNREEFKKLATLNYQHKNVRTSKRVYQIAKTYFDAINKYFKVEVN